MKTRPTALELKQAKPLLFAVKVARCCSLFANDTSKETRDTLASLTASALAGWEKFNSVEYLTENCQQDWPEIELWLSLRWLAEDPQNPERSADVLTDARAYASALYWSIDGFPYDIDKRVEAEACAVHYNLPRA